MSIKKMKTGTVMAVIASGLVVPPLDTILLAEDSLMICPKRQLIDKEASRGVCLGGRG